MLVNLVAFPERHASRLRRFRRLNGIKSDIPSLTRPEPATGKPLSGHRECTQRRKTVPLTRTSSTRPMKRTAPRRKPTRTGRWSLKTIWTHHLGMRTPRTTGCWIPIRTTRPKTRMKAASFGKPMLLPIKSPPAIPTTRSAIKTADIMPRSSLPAARTSARGHQDRHHRLLAPKACNHQFLVPRSRRCRNRRVVLSRGNGNRGLIGWNPVNPRFTTLPQGRPRSSPTGDAQVHLLQADRLFHQPSMRGHPEPARRSAQLQARSAEAIVQKEPRRRPVANPLRGAARRM